jgi:membrane protease YdiL (CAAX protease family)
MFKSGSAERHPLSSLLILFLMFFSGAIVFGALAIGIAALIYGSEYALQAGSTFTSLNIGSLRLLQIISSFGMFVVAAVIFAKVESNDWMKYLSFKKVNPLLAILTILIMLSMGPLMESINELNKNMVLPEALKEIEAWMKLKEEQMTEMTKQLLVMDSVNILLVNMLMLAIIPALGEELIFRACLQKIFGRWTGNYHLAIWLSAIIFSTIHFQFYGFMPRMFLGALFGYLLVWSGSIWLPILAHFLNNGMAVVGAYILQQQGKPIEQTFENDPVSIPVFISSTLAFVGLIWYFHNYTAKTRENNIELSDGSRLD